MKKLFILFILNLSIILSAEDKLSQLHTMLVVVEESENTQVLSKETPATDGLLDALWDFEQFIFFDMKVNESLKITNNELDASAYAIQAKDSGADSILLIKIIYLSVSEGESVIIKPVEIIYKLISLNRLTTIRVGKFTLGADEKINKKEKYNRLKKIGDQALRKILN